MQDKTRKHSKISEITFYVGLFLFIFAIVIFISLAAKNAFGQTSSVINALIGVASASIVLGVGFLATSGVFF
ncbi:Uncharacterised protein [Chlamydia trachomatis]|nr:Uncharacterised protein [Chlamydia trachomatis]